MNERGRSAQEGFTILELLIIILVIAVLAYIIAPQLARPHIGVPNRVYDLPAERMQAEIVSLLQAPPLNLGVDSVNEGRIETTYKDIPGEWHGILWGRKRWQGRFKLTVEVRTAWSQPNKSQLLISLEEQERANEHYPWQQAGVSPEAESFKQLLLRSLDRKIGGR